MQIGESEPFICELLTSLTATILDLESHQIHMFYEAVGLMISAESDPKKREAYLVRMSVFPAHSASPFRSPHILTCIGPYLGLGDVWLIGSM